ncbi:MAG: MBL fold metallo-hydrolase [Chloroflexi bacterium]|nr:MBL fold metallo-hydrolase [Chloroflexota bacterium]
MMTKIKQLTDPFSQIGSDVYCIDGGMSNFFLGVEPDGLTLIDAGVPKRQHLVWDLLEILGKNRDEIKHIIITHADYDHVGSLAQIQSATGATIYAGAETAVHIQNGTFPDHLSWLAKFVASKIMGGYHTVPSDTIKIMQAGDILPMMGGVQVFATPGHTPDHHSIYCPLAGVLFAGDAINTRNGRIQPSPKRVTHNQQAAAQSAIQILELAPATIACGHGTPLQNHSMGSLMSFFNELRQK